MTKMTRNHRTAVRYVALSAIAFLLAAMSPAFAQQGNPRFYKVEERLDRGGSFYLYVDVKDLVRGVVNDLRQASMQPGMPPAGMMALTVSDRVIDRLGVYGVHDIGISSIADTGSLYLTKTYLNAPEGRTGFLALLGDAPHAFPVLQVAPADSAVVWSLDFNAAGLLALVRQVATDAVGAAAAQQIDQTLAAFSQQVGGDVNAAIQSLRGDLWLIGRFDGVRTMRVEFTPGSETALAEPQVLLSVAVTDDSLFNLVRTAMARKNVAGPESAVNGMRIVPFQTEVPPQWQVSPVIATDGARFYITTHVSLLDMLDATRRSGANVTTNPEFVEMRSGLPTEGNGLSFVSVRLTEWAQALIMKAFEAQPDVNKTALTTLLLDKEDPVTGAMSVTRCEADGVWTVSRSSSGGREFLVGAAVVPAAILAAIAIPNFLEAEQRSQVSRAKADMRSLATAIEAYSVDTDTYPAWTSGPEGSIYGTLAAPGGPLAGQPTFRMKANASDPVMTLTTPIMYLTSVPSDPFSPVGGQAFSYWGDNGRWLVWSAGPDKVYDITLENVPKAFAPDNTPSDLLKQKTYDPTNGTVSSGDVWRIRQ